MTIKMRLDTEGLRTMIAANPELEVEIGREVLENIKREAIQGAVQGQLDACIKGMVENQGGWASPRYVIKDQRFLGLVAEVIREATREALIKAIETEVQTRVALAIEEERWKLGTEIPTILRALVTPEMARDIVREKIL